MDITEAINTRRSIRSFIEKPVDRQIIEEIIHAGTLAPSASNAQFWRFIAADDADLVRKLDLYCPGLSGKPPVIITIASDLDEVEQKGSKNSLVYGCMMDAAMAAENMMLKALDYGLGTCAIKSYNEAAVRKLLCLPETYRIELVISLGYPDGEPRERKRKPTEELLFWNDMKKY